MVIESVFDMINTKFKKDMRLFVQLHVQLTTAVCVPPDVRASYPVARRRGRGVHPESGT